MIVVMKHEHTQDEIDEIQSVIKQGGAKPMVSVGEGTTIIGVVGLNHTLLPEHLSLLDGVDRVIPISAPYKLAGRDLHKDDSQFTIQSQGGASFTLGGKTISIIAGPCTVESEEQIITTAKEIKNAGGHALRGGAFKPRTSPYSFQGLKEEGLKFLATARQETGLPIVTETITPETVELVASYADVLQVGARNMQNYALLEAVGKTHKPVLLKRGLCATLDEFLLAAEYILVHGTKEVILCERGVRTFESDTRFTLSLGSIPILQEKTHLPIIVDPSHGTGRASAVAPMCRASIAAGAHGVIVEVHPDPSHAKVDGDQSIGPDVFRQIMVEMRRMAPILGKEVCNWNQSIAVA
ncbi:3-deoxy-7-phosphoheptulonate synthase [bacterium]|nr:3-deoxy-7-phosphoheptulonate synthase [bacterium]